jgi:phosphatidylglycerophosphatase A
MTDGSRDAGFGHQTPNPQSRVPSPESRIPALLLSTALGVGYIPFAPGTFGSAAGLLLWALLPPSPGVQAFTIVALFVLGSWSGSVAERHFGRADPGQVVIDEVMGMLITLFLNPVGWGGALWGFLLFRAADIVKPYPANRFERLHGGAGIMADDAMAAVYANLALRVTLALRGTLALGNWIIG